MDKSRVKRIEQAIARAVHENGMGYVSLLGFHNADLGVLILDGEFDVEDLEKLIVAMKTP